MANKEIWKFSKFEGGINNHTDPKDIKSDEFVELIDCDISTVGIIKPIGQALKSNEISQDFTYELFAGTGFHNYFSDWTFNHSDVGHIEMTQLRPDNIVSNGTASSIILSKDNDSDGMLWLFRGKPVGGTLKILRDIIYG